MRITSIVLPSPDPHRLARFFAGVLGLATDLRGDRAYVPVGHTAITVVPGARTDGGHHLAITIPSASLAAATAFVAARAPLLDRDGAVTFAFDPPFGPSNSIYFIDPDGSLLELIARDVPGRPVADDQFRPDRDIVGVGEVAVPVAAVPDAVIALREDQGLEPVLAEPEFAAVGDHQGMVILVAPDRVWFPTTDRRPNATPLVIATDVGSGVRTVFANGSSVSG